MTDKTALRQALKTRRDAFVAALEPEQRDAHEIALTERLINIIAQNIAAPPSVWGRFAADKAICIAGYIPIASEFDIRPALIRACDAGYTTALPRITTHEAPMRFIPWRPGDILETGRFGLSQSVDGPAIIPDIILTPLVGFDRAGNRLGQGAGYYDRYFAAAPNALRIGIAWATQRVDRIIPDPWDIPLHAIITEQEYIGLNS